MFRGFNIIHLDDKGRLAVPTRYRETLLQDSNGALVITVGLALGDHERSGDRYLWMVPLGEWGGIQDKLTALPGLGRPGLLKRMLLGHATDCTMDRGGRVLLPPPLREFAVLDKQVVLSGQGNKFEIWNDEAWKAGREEWLATDEDAGPLPPELETLSL